MLGPGGHPVGNLEGKLDGFHSDDNGTTVSGWAVDTALPRDGWGPVVVVILVDGEAVGSTLASADRPDLVKAGVAPNPNHGFSFLIPDRAVRVLMGNGRHVLTVKAVASPSSVVPFALPEKGTVVCVDGKCA